MLSALMTYGTGPVSDLYASARARELMVLPQITLSHINIRLKELLGI